MLFTEVFWELLAGEFVQVLTGVGQFIRTRYHQRVVWVVDDTLQRRHGLWVDNRGHMVSHEEQTGLGVVDDIVYLFGIELMQDGYGDGSIGEGGDEGHGPLGGVTSAEGDLVTLLNPAVLKKDVQFLYLSGYIMEL